MQSTSKTDAIKPTQGQKKTESSPKDNEASSTPTLLKEIQGAPTAQTATENSVPEADKEKVVLWTIPKIVITLCHDDEPAIPEQPDTELTTADSHVVGEKESVKVDPPVISVEKVSPDSVALEVVLEKEHVENQVNNRYRCVYL